MAYICTLIALAGQHASAATYFSRLARATKIGRYLERTKERRTKISSTLGGFAATAYLSSYSADAINEVRCYHANDPESQAPDACDRPIKPIGYQCISKGSEYVGKIGALGLGAAYIIRFPLTAIPLLSLYAGAHSYHEKTSDHWHAMRLKRIVHRLKNLQKD